MPPIVPTPNVPINFVAAEMGEIIPLGKLTLRVMEDGSRTDNRISVMELTIPPHTPGPPAHWHEMHDETFLVTKGTVRFTVPSAPGLEGKAIDAKAGDYVVVPTRAPHTFSNETDEEAKFVNTFTPAFYIHYFKLLSTLMANGETMTPEVNEQAMAYYATIPVQNSNVE
ncbi:RmlC-like cupin domain-containing protein [Rhexocercosporidium sp. MPI-PUGE-AT-0058]|nr:RmlC-like cupin domain-containing protein [Rhexocercosporidium sp. MPI-PUGE-AT-0058]